MDVASAPQTDTTGHDGGYAQSMPSDQGPKPVEREVIAWYRANDHPARFRFVHVPCAETPCPLSGLSVGWLPATVLDDDGNVEVDGESTQKRKVKFHGCFQDPYRGVVDGVEMSVSLDLIRPLAPVADPGASLQLPRPLLSVLCVRWYDYWSYQWASDYNVTSDQMLVDLFDGPSGLTDVLPGEHQVHTIYIRRSEDLQAVSEQWALQVMGNAVHKVAWYFLWPTAAASGPGMKAGCVCEREFFALAQRLERVGIRTGWPHPSQLYRLLCGKLWVPQMCLNTEYYVPPTTRVHYQEFKANPEGAARKAIEHLVDLQRALWGETESEPQAPFRGVVKLGFSWQGKDVKPFVGAEALAQALRELLSQPASRQLVCMVQAMVPSVICEMRALVFRDAANGKYVWRYVYMKLWDKDDKYRATGVDGFSMTSASVVQSEDAASAFFNGDASVVAEVQKQCDALVDRWLLWFKTECAEPPPFTRMDFLVSRPDESKPPRLWTCEVTECGCSLCHLHSSARSAAAVNFAMLNETSSGRFPQPLPEFRVLENPCFF